MEDLPRPEPLRSLPDHVRAVLDSIGVGRIIGAVFAGLAVVALGWWLVRPPAPRSRTRLPGPTPLWPSRPRWSRSASRPSWCTSREPSGDPASTAWLLVLGVIDAIEQAGGARSRADLDAVNLAAPVADGQQVVVPRLGEVVPTVIGDNPTADAGPVDVNRASETELDELPGVGPSTAAAIVRFREENGPFATVDDLEQVPGIGPAKLDALRDLVTV